MTTNDIVDIRNNIDMRKQFIDLDRPAPTSLLARIADKAPALCDEVEQLRTEHSDALPQITAAWDALNRAGFQSPVDGIAALIDQLAEDLAETTAALTKARTEAATHADEVGRLVAENARVRQQRDELTTALRRAENGLALADSGRIALLAEVDRLRDEQAGVVEAAKVWAKAADDDTPDGFLKATDALHAAVAALPKAEATR